MKWTLLQRTLMNRAMNRALIKRNFTNSGQLWVIVLPLVVLPLVLVAYAAAGGVPTDPAPINRNRGTA
jgi:hypothetical protein